MTIWIDHHPVLPSVVPRIEVVTQAGRIRV
jgi:hypothetical protein